jgi:type 1 fimbriae regulatory protein FimB/type 1 fimbriae regulatory protein FimE
MKKYYKNIIYGKVGFKMSIPPKKIKNIERRNREYLTPKEIDKLILTAKKIGRYGQRDSTMILVAFRHGLRVSELIALKWSQIDLDQGLLHVIRLKGGINSTHPLFGPEIRALKKLKKSYSDSEYVFMTERKTPITSSTFRKILLRVGIKSDITIPIHPHMLRHSTGFKLVNEGHDIRSIQYYLGHKNIQHTVRYTEVATMRFNNFWKD